MFCSCDRNNSFLNVSKTGSQNVSSKFCSTYLYKVTDGPSLVLELPNNIKVYQGNKYDAENISKLKNLDVKYVVNATKHLENHGEKAGLEYMRVYINDTVQDTFGPLLDNTADWMHEKIKRKNGNIFVHCHAGISRSSTITISYMIKYLGYDPGQALFNIRKGRNIANPNRSFWKELEIFGKKFKEKGMCII